MKSGKHGPMGRATLRDTMGSHKGEIPKTARSSDAALQFVLPKEELLVIVG